VKARAGLRDCQQGVATNLWWEHPELRRVTTPQTGPMRHAVILGILFLILLSGCAGRAPELTPIAIGVQASHTQVTRV